jgi:hypothetical protein
MQLKRRFVALVVTGCLVGAAQLRAQAEPEGSIDVDILVSYYDQDGDRSPVTGGVGTEKLEVVSPVVLLAWRIDESLSLTADIGLDQISSASIGNIQTELSSASIPASDTRTFGNIRLKRKWGSHSFGLTLGGAREYDYESISYGLDWGTEFNQANTAVSVGLRRFDDAVDLIGIDGEGTQGGGLPPTSGQGDRTTTDLNLSLSQTLGRRTVGSVELFLSQQEGVLSTPYHEVILASGDPGTEGEHVAERLPDSRDRQALGLRLNHSWNDGIVQRTAYRYYTDDWGISSHTLEFELHFRLPVEREMWLFPILRYHTQTEADYYGGPGFFSGLEDYYTADGDLGENATSKLGLGWSVNTRPGEDFLGTFDRFEMRASAYDRDDGLTGFATSFGFGWTF